MSYPYRIMVTGSRDWELAWVIHRELLTASLKAKGRRLTLVQGDARGADTIAREFAKSEGWRIETYQPNYNLHGDKAPHVRNSLMVDSNPNVVLAFILEQGGSGGTWSTYKKAVNKGLKVYPFYQDDYL